VKTHFKTVPLTSDPAGLDYLLQETDELTRIFVASIRTAEINKLRENPVEGYEV